MNKYWITNVCFKKTVTKCSYWNITETEFSDSFFWNRHYLNVEISIMKRITRFSPWKIGIYNRWAKCWDQYSCLSTKISSQPTIMHTTVDTKEIGLSPKKALIWMFLLMWTWTFDMNHCVPVQCTLLVLIDFCPV